VAGFALVAAVVAPGSRGCVRLASANPDAAPLIDPRFLRAGRDGDRLAEGLSLVRQAAGGSAFDGLRRAELWPGTGVRTSGELRAYIRRTVSSYYHPAGTCAMGTGPGAVVDPWLRVHGVAGLRVADASVMPTIPNAHPNATVLAIAERAAELITGRSPVHM
jgi:choline dehydrogenase